MKPNVSRQRITAAFTRAKRTIALKAEDYICRALKRDRTDPEAARAAIRVVRQRMGPPPHGITPERRRAGFAATVDTLKRDNAELTGAQRPEQENAT